MTDDIMFPTTDPAAKELIAEAAREQVDALFTELKHTKAIFNANPTPGNFWTLIMARVRYAIGIQAVHGDGEPPKAPEAM
jgi:hypothetical protein